MKIIVISGGIGSGKSAACSFLEATYGWPVYEADLRVKELYQEHSFLLDSIETALKESFRGSDGKFIPRLLAGRIFSDAEALNIVEGLVFPVMEKDFEQWKESRSDKEFAIFESATILEKPALERIGDYRIVIDAPIETRVARATARDGITIDAVRKRMLHQRLMNRISEGFRPEGIFRVISNDSSIGQLHENLRNLAEEISKTKMLTI